MESSKEMDAKERAERIVDIIKEVFDELNVRDPTKPGTKISKEKFNFDKIFAAVWRAMVKDIAQIVYERKEGEDDIACNINLLNILMYEYLGLNLKYENENTVVIYSPYGITTGLGESSGKDLWFCK